MPRQISPVELAKKQAQGESLAIIDVRTPMEFRHVHVPNAINLPLPLVSLESVREAADSAPVYVICKSGHRATKACGQLAGPNGLSVTLVKGGTDAWIAAGLEVVRGAGAWTPGRMALLIAGLILAAMLAQRFLQGGV